jgi:Sensors of blue-light using FAD
MRSIVYFSSATVPMPKAASEALRQECADNDSHVGITGMLLYQHGNFLQVIEGSAAVIRDMFARIVADPRHTSIRTISDRMIPCREFDGQAVGFKNLDALAEGTPFLKPFTYEAYEADPDLALLTLSYFYHNP